MNRRKRRPIVEEMNERFNTVTIWERRNSRLNSQWDNIRYRDWCRKECARMRSHGAEVYVHEEEEHDIAAIVRGEEPANRKAI